MFLSAACLKPGVAVSRTARSLVGYTSRPHFITTRNFLQTAHPGLEKTGLTPTSPPQNDNSIQQLSLDTNVGTEDSRSHQPVQHSGSKTSDVAAPPSPKPVPAVSIMENQRPLKSADGFSDRQLAQLEDVVKQRVSEHVSKVNYSRKAQQPVAESSDPPIEKQIIPTPANESDLKPFLPSSALVLSHLRKDGRLDRVPYWQSINRWAGVTERDWLTNRWQNTNAVSRSDKLVKFMQENLPSYIPSVPGFEHIQTREDYVKDVEDGIKKSSMAVRLTPHMLSCADWNNPLTDPIIRQFVPLKSAFLPDHPKADYDSLHEKEDEKVRGLVHRYKEKILFLATNVCPLYCIFCTRSYGVGNDTGCVTKHASRPSRELWGHMLDYIEQNKHIHDVVVSGGDSYMLEAAWLAYLGEQLLAIPHIRRIRIATKGLAVSPSRILDSSDPWTSKLISISNLGKLYGKEVVVHTHFNHPNEITWVSREAAYHLRLNGVDIRNQTVLLRGVNDNVATMGKLLHELGDINIQPYYVYQCDMVRGIEDLRTPLHKILHLQNKLRGSIAGFNTPQFVVDLPGGGGKVLSNAFLNYDRTTGLSLFKSEVPGREDRIFEYWDPHHSLEQ